MKKLLFIIILISGFSATAQTKIIKFPELEKIMKTSSAEIQVINFWATWCAPCVKELPLFEKLNNENHKVKVTLINLDFADKLEKVNAFVDRKKIKSTVLLLDEIDYNSWIEKVDKNWSGAIPATLIINPQTGKRKFIEKSLEEGDLEKLLQDVL